MGWLSPNSIGGAIVAGVSAYFSGGSSLAVTAAAAAGGYAGNRQDAAIAKAQKEQEEAQKQATLQSSKNTAIHLLSSNQGATLSSYLGTYSPASKTTLGG